MIPHNRTPLKPLALALSLACAALLAAPAARAAADTYLVVDLSGGTNAASYPVSYLDAVPSGGWTDTYKTDKLVLRKIPAGTFTMGSPADSAPPPACAGPACRQTGTADRRLLVNQPAAGKGKVSRGDAETRREMDWE